MADGSAEISILAGMPGRVDTMTCTLQLLDEVHDPAAYITPDATVDFTGIRLEEIAPNRVRVTGARFPTALVSVIATVWRLPQTAPAGTVYAMSRVTVVLSAMLP